MNNNVLRLLGVLTVILLLAAAATGCRSESCDGSDCAPPTDGDEAEAEVEAVVEEEAVVEVAEEAATEEPTEAEPEAEVEAEPEIPELAFAPAGPDAAPDPLAEGPFPVGVVTIDYFDTSRPGHKGVGSRWLRAEIWYPIQEKFRNDPPHVYRIEEQAADVDLGDMRQQIMDANLPEIATPSVYGAPVDTDHGPYPLILFSHGANGIRWQSVFYTIHLASHGYIVASVDHEDNTMWDIFRDGYDMGSILRSGPDRLEDMPFLLDRMLEANRDPENALYQTIIEDQVAITGHSFGGFTSVAMPCRDERFKYAVPHAPLISLAELVGCALDEYPVPIMIMGGTKDITLKWDAQYCDYRLLSAPEKYLFELVDGGHFTFSDICMLDLAAIAPSLGITNAERTLNDGCATDNVDWEEAHEAINYYATAFFNYHLRGSTTSKDYLVDENEYPFEAVNFFIGDTAPDWPADGGCAAVGQGGL